MTISKFGVELKRLTVDKIELVRAWRNDPKISRSMFFAQHITAEMQQKWFESIDNEHNFYFLIYYHGKAVGLIHTSEIDNAKKTAFSGLFIYDESYWGTDVPVRASLAMLDFFFAENSIETFFAKTKKDNKAAILYNEMLGFEVESEIEKDTGLLLKLTKENYYRASARLQKIAERVKG
ncbi:MAG TPA: GNAT family N-acetyltransferase [Chitinophagales bacterium]